jgi:hypothetical protein
MRSVTAYYILIVAVLLYAAGAMVLRGQEAPAAMLQADQAFVEAIDRGDSAALDRLLDADFTWTDSNGKTLTKAGVLKNIPRSAIQKNETPAVKSYGYGELGDVQASAGREHTVRVWAKRPGGWKAIAYQEVESLAAPPTATPSAGKGCENPCKGIPYQAKSDTERAVSEAYARLETAAMAHNSPVFATMVADEFVAASSNSNKVYDKRGRMDDFDHAKMAGVAPTPLVSARMFDFGDAVLMRSEHQPDRGKPLHVTRVWVKREGRWMETLSYQTSVAAP